MKQQVLKDKYFRIIGYINTDSSGRQTLKNAHFKILGYYDPKTNKTKDYQFRPIGTGNLLMTLL